MGHSRKDEIARLKQERREAKIAKKRKENVREKHVRFLIVCEGEKTEPFYFESLIENNISTVREVHIEGQGKSTVALVNETLMIKEDLERKNAMTFDRVWAVFDKDDFEDFNKAIMTANKKGVQTAWTNEAFELWYYLHFEFLDTGIGRSAYIEKLEEFFRKKTGDDNFKYEKKNPKIYQLLHKYGKEDLAKRFAKRLRDYYHDTNYALHKPCTMVDKLVVELENPEKMLSI
jgi:hypothetical protein